jgi:hypothetical protein
LRKGNLKNVRQKRKVAAELGIDESTVQKRLNAGSGVTALGRYKQVFTKTQESELAEHCKDLDDNLCINSANSKKSGL